MTISNGVRTDISKNLKKFFTVSNSHYNSSQVVFIKSQLLRGCSKNDRELSQPYLSYIYTNLKIILDNHNSDTYSIIYTPCTMTRNLIKTEALRTLVSITV